MAKDRKIDMVILGLLAHEDLTGYDIKKRIDGAISLFWKGSFGSIYPALSSMEKEGLVEKKADATGKRERIFYHVTDKGIDCLKAWLEDEKVTNDLKYETLLKLHFGGSVDRATSLKNVEAFEKEIAEKLSLLQLYKKNLEPELDNEDHLHYYLTVSFGITTYEAYLKWCEEAKKLLGL